MITYDLFETLEILRVIKIWYTKIGLLWEVTKGSNPGF